MLYNNYRPNKIQKRENEGDISRREFLDGMRTFFTGVVYVSAIGPFAKTAWEIGAANQETVRQLQKGLDLESELKVRQLNGRTNKIKEEKEQEKKRAYEELRRKELEEPSLFELGEGSDSFNVARMLYGEQRGEFRNQDLLKYTASVPLIRADLSGRTIPEVIYASRFDQDNKITTYAFSSVNPNDLNRKYLENPLWDVKNSPLDRKAWERCYYVAEDLLNTKDVAEVTHFCTNNPKWARGKKPVKTFQSGKGKLKFYYIPEHFKKA
ncbi:MAG: hypothetical protein AABW91_04045 [Nanoarchaeota archaeon]